MQKWPAAISPGQRNWGFIFGYALDRIEADMAFLKGNDIDMLAKWLMNFIYEPPCESRVVKCVQSGS